MPVTRKKRNKKRVISNSFDFSPETVVPTPEEIVQKPQGKPKSSFDAKKPLNKKVVSNKNYHRTSNK